MKERRVKIIIAVMTVAVLGLIAVQLYWLGSLIKVEEERFNRSVNNALVKSVIALEKEEAAKIIVKKIIGKKPNHIKYFNDKLDSKDNLFLFSPDSNTRIMKVTSGSRDFTYQLIPDADSLHTRSFVIRTDGPKGKKIETEAQIKIMKEKYDTVITHRKKLVQNVVTEMFTVEHRKKIEDRISVNQLKRILTKEMSNAGIDSNFYFGVKNDETGKLALVRNGADKNLLAKSDYRTMLFPGELFTEKNELVVTFPDKNKYIFSSIIGMMSLSILFILLIIGVFFKTVQMFIRQKKITEVKNDLINNITHEFKTPISTISIACEALNEPVLSAEKSSVAKYSRIIKEENNRLQLMVDTLLNTAALEKDEISIYKEEFDLNKIIADASQKFDENLKQKNGKINLELSADCILILGDKFHLMNVLCNLIDNAIKYNEREPEILINTFSDAATIVISIKDNGIGINKDSLKKIFDTFYRVQSGNIQNVRGNGIGLSYSKKIIELHGGSIGVESQPASGSIFKITLPIK